MIHASIFLGLLVIMSHALQNAHAQNPRVLDAHKGIVYDIAFSKDGQLLASAGEDKQIYLWDINTLNQIRSFRGHSDSVCSIEFCHNDKTLISGSCDGTIKLWDVKSGQTIATLRGHKSCVYSVAISPDGQTLLSVGLDSKILLWNLTQRKLVAILDGHMGEISKVIFSSNGARFATAGRDQIIRIWSLKSPRPIQLLKTKGYNISYLLSDAMVMDMAFTSDGKKLISVAHDQTIRLWDMATGRIVSTVKSKTENLINCVAISKDDRFVAFGGTEVGSKLRLLDLTTKTVKYSFNVSPSHSTGPSVYIFSTAFSPNGEFVLCGSTDGKIRIWRICRK